MVASERRARRPASGSRPLTLRLLQRRCGVLTIQQQVQLQALPLERLETLADALLDFQGPDDLAAWLRVNGA